MMHMISQVGLILAAVPKAGAAAHKAAATATSAAAAPQGFFDHIYSSLPTRWPGQVDLLTWCKNMGPAPASLLVIAGLIYLLFGYHHHKQLITLNAMLIGGLIGGLLGRSMGAPTPGAVVGGVLAFSITWPFMKWAVAVMGGLSGMLLGASMWLTADLDPQYKWAGAAIGLIALGMLSFILFRGSIITYTALQGSVMLLFGLLGLFLQYQNLAPRITDKASGQPLMLPCVAGGLWLVGWVFQLFRFPPPAPAKK